MPLWIACIMPVVIDGDSLRCRNLGEVRLLGIDAPDLRRSRPCREGFGDHVCDDRGARSAKNSLRRGVRLGPVQVQPVGRDRYRRSLAMVRAGSVMLNCWQLRTAGVRYIARYDNGGRVRAACRY